MEIQIPLVLFTSFLAWSVGIFGTQALLAMKKKGGEIQVPSLIAAVIVLAIGGIAVVFHLTHPFNLFNGFGHLTSGITQELIAIVILVVVMVIYFLMLRRSEDNSVPAWLAVLAIVAGLILIVAMGHSYMMPSRPAWNSILQLLSLLGAACVLGPATVAIIAGAKKVDIPELGLFNVVGSLVNAVLVAAFLGIMSMAGGSFESFSQQTFSTAVKLIISYSPFSVTWWQLYDSDPWWAVNSPVTLNSECTPAYQDFKTFPTVSLFSDGAYSGNSAIVATIAIHDAASLILYGDEHGGELFIGSANNLNEESWAKTSEGHAFSSRPSALSFKYKLDSSDNAPFQVSVSILSEDGTLLASSTAGSSTSVSSWTEYTVPLSYSVTNKKAGMIRMSFKSSESGSESSRAKTITTLSGEHDIHAGNILYLDDITLKYE